MVEAARIACVAAGSPSADNMPGELRFSVNSGSSGATERLRITSAGRMGLGTNDPNALFEVRDSENTTQGNAQIRISKGVGGGAAPATITRANTYLHLGGTEWGSGANGKYLIGLGYTNDEVGTGIPAYMGFTETSVGGYTQGDLIFGTRGNTTGTNNPTERLRITSAGRIGIGRDDPSCLLDIREYTNTSGTNNGTTMIRLQNNVGSDSGSLGDITGINGQRTYIDFTFIDANANFTPQVRIGAQAGEPSGNDDGIQNEGSGSFVVYTAAGSGNAGSGTLTEKLKVTPEGNVKASNSFFCGGSNAAGMFQLAASAGNTVIDTGISVNASNGGGAMMVLASRNTSDQTSTAAGMYLLDFRYSGNHVPGVTFIGGDNFCVFSKSGSNNLTVNCQAGNWSVAAFFGGYGIGNQLNR